MTPVAIINEATADGVNLILSPAGNIKVEGRASAVNRWLPLIRQRKPEIIAALQRAVDEVPVEKMPPVPIYQMGIEEEAAIRAWLDYVNECDPVVIDEVLAECHRDTYVRAYFNRLADGVPRAGEPDDRPCCNGCANLTVSGSCLAAWRGEILAHMDFTPVSNLRLRCQGYKPVDIGPDAGALP